MSIGKMKNVKKVFFKVVDVKKHQFTTFYKNKKYKPIFS